MEVKNKNELMIHEPQVDWLSFHSQTMVTAFCTDPSILITVEPLITHTPRWTAQGMRYEGLCVWRGMITKSWKKIRKKLDVLNYSTTSMIS